MLSSKTQLVLLGLCMLVLGAAASRQEFDGPDNYQMFANNNDDMNLYRRGGDQEGNSRIENRGQGANKWDEEKKVPTGFDWKDLIKGGKQDPKVPGPKHEEKEKPFPPKKDDGIKLPPIIVKPKPEDPKEHPTKPETPKPHFPSFPPKHDGPKEHPTKPETPKPHFPSFPPKHDGPKEHPSSGPFVPPKHPKPDTDETCDRHPNEQCDCKTSCDGAVTTCTTTTCTKGQSCCGGCGVSKGAIISLKEAQILAYEAECELEAAQKKYEIANFKLQIAFKKLLSQDCCDEDNYCDEDEYCDDDNRKPYEHKEKKHERKEKDDGRRYKDGDYEHKEKNYERKEKDEGRRYKDGDYESKKPFSFGQGF